MSRGVTALYGFSLLGIGANIWQLILPGDDGNGITTLPFMLLLLAALTASSLRLVPGPVGRLGASMVQVRRHLGINAALWGLGHVLMKTTLTLAIQPESLLAHMVRPEIVSACVGLLVLVLLLLSSSDAAVRSLGRQWKRLHQFVWLLPGIALYHGHEASENFTDEGEMHLPVLIPIVLMWLVPVTGLPLGI